MSIKASLFDQKIYESSLAKYASRMINLYYAKENVQEKIKGVEFLKMRLKHNEAGRRQLETLTATAF